MVKIEVRMMRFDEKEFTPIELEMELQQKDLIVNEELNVGKKLKDLFGDQFDPERHKVIEFGNIAQIQTEGRSYIDFCCTFRGTHSLIIIANGQGRRYFRSPY